MQFDDKIDYGPEGIVFNAKEVAIQNKYYRRAVWTGDYMQMTVMDIPPRGDVGLEKHEDTDQMLMIMQGVGTVYMGESEDKMERLGDATPNYVIMVPAGTYHNVVNNTSMHLKLMSLYAPPHHKKGVIQKSKNDPE